jgi:hypothetical protein
VLRQDLSILLSKGPDAVAREPPAAQKQKQQQRKQQVSLTAAAGSTFAKYAPLDSVVASTAFMGPFSIHFAAFAGAKCRVQADRPIRCVSELWARERDGDLMLASTP